MKSIIYFILKLLFYCVPILSMVMISINYWVLPSLIVLGIFLCLFFYNFFKMGQKLRSVKISQFKLIITFFIIYFYLIISFSFGYAGIMKLYPTGNGLYTSRDHTRLQCNKWNDYIHIIYFSTVTATTLGYGDIYPGGNASRVVALIEVMTLPFFAISVFNAISGVKNPQKTVIKKAPPHTVTNI